MFLKEKKEIKFRAIIEIMGRPAELLTETLNKTVEQLEKDEKVKVLRKEIFEPKETDEKDIFSSFAELELAVESMEDLFEFIVNYIPSNIEIMSPSEIKMPIDEANSAINSFIIKFQKNNSLMKRASFENLFLKKKISEMMQKQEVEELKKEDKKLEESEKKEKAKKKK